jgi:hypothetical protein
MSPENEKIFIHYADPSLWERKNRHGEVFSTADEYKDEGIILKPADNDRLSGKRKVDRALADLPDGEPGLQVFEECEHTIEQFGSLATDKNNPEDVDTDQEDHAYDTARYGLTNEKKIERQAEADRTPPARNPYNRVQGI